MVGELGKRIFRVTEKRAAYLISDVRYNAANTHIDKVRSRVDQLETVGTATELSRLTNVARLDSGSTYATITKRSDGKWYFGKGAEVTVDGMRYIKTVADSTKNDNLGVFQGSNASRPESTSWRRSPRLPNSCRLWPPHWWRRFAGCRYRRARCCCSTRPASRRLSVSPWR
jgi:hypothetical protein